MNARDWFRDKVVIITGSARGIGREAARLALDCGARVVINGRDQSSVEQTRQRLGATDRCLAVAADLSRPEEAAYLVATVLAAWGRIDVVINNAGLSMRGAFSELSPETVKAMIDANLLTALWTTRAALEALRASQGRVLFVSSLAGVRGFPQVSAYSATKQALSGLAESLRAEEAPHGLSVGLVWLGFAQNDPEKTVWSADGRQFRHERRWSMTQTRAARVLLDAVRSGRRRTVVTAAGRALIAFQGWFPALVDLFVASRGGKLHSVKEKLP